MSSKERIISWSEQFSSRISSRDSVWAMMYICQSWRDSKVLSAIIILISLPWAYKPYYYTARHLLYVCSKTTTTKIVHCMQQPRISEKRYWSKTTCIVDNRTPQLVLSAWKRLLNCKGQFNFNTIYILNKINHQNREGAK